jgi:omega-6 fatty acid desaturase / acyl-lipid omega-6 desaturase (Delta-12 desaturase)
MSSLDDEKNQGFGKLTDTYGNQFEVPDYTVNDIRNAIPKHCFERSGLRGLSYVARDIGSLATTFFLFNKFVTAENIPSTPVRAALWFVYTVLQGFFGTGLWVLAHECGHQSFSPSKILNDTTGWFCHSALLVPYFSWKISHGKHHKATGHMERDMVFVPKTRQEYATRIGKFVHELHELTEETPIATIIHSIGQQLLGWPMYLFANVTGHNFHERQPEGRGKGKSNGFFKGVNHFDLSSPLYEAKDAKLILLSDLGLAITITALVMLSKTYGFSNMAVWYFAPYLWVNNWLGMYSSNISYPEQLANIPQLPLPISNTLIPRFLTMHLKAGTTCAVPPQPLTVNSVLLAALSFTGSSRHTSYTTMSAPSHSTTPTRQLRQSNQSWASITVPTSRVVLSDF